MSVQHYLNPLEAFAVACALPKDGQQWLVVSARRDWAYVYPACAEFSLSKLIEKAKADPDFDCFVRHRPPNVDNYRGHGPYQCLICGFGIQDHDRVAALT